jgi:acyl-CoA synthetase (AMP-forming)/AMP-acid ligase II
MPETLISLWDQAVSRAPRAVAVVESSGAHRWTREELTAYAEAWRQGLPSLRGLRGRRIVMAQANGADWLRTFIGILSVGAIPAPVDPGEPPDALEAIARGIGASWIWAGDHLRLLPPLRRPGGRDLCLAKVTSGSTGLPRAFTFTHRQMIADGRQICATMGIREGDVNLAVVPLGHSYGLGNLVVPLLAQGTPVVCGNGPFPQAIASDCQTWRPTVLPAVPILLRALADADVPKQALATLRLVISAGSPLFPDIACAFHARFGRRVHNFYGSSETGGICFDATGEATLEGRSVGTPLQGVRLAPSPGRRFTVVSPAVMGRGRHRPKDYGTLSGAGELVLLGRSDRTVKIGAKRLDPAEIERALKALPRVRDALVFSYPRKGEGLAAAVLTGESPAAIRRALAGCIAAWKVPGWIAALDEFPMTARGKPDVRGIEALLRDSARAHAPGTAG